MIYDIGTGTPVIYHHGTPNLGAPPEPLFTDGVRWIGYDRAGYGDAPAEPGRDIASAAAHTARVADELGLDRFAVFGHSGGGPHALACAALLGDRVTAAVSISGPAPYGAAGLDWFAGMTSPGSLQAAVRGRAAKEAYEADPPETDPPFIDADWAALEGTWSWFGQVVGPAMAAGPAALIDDDLAAVADWGFDPGRIGVPTLLVHGDRDAMVPSSHSEWLAGRIPGAELRIGPGDGHISILQSQGRAALQWVLARS
jgi:pimeloyl-ACP methyl ester carboxylesterase